MNDQPLTIATALMLAEPLPGDKRTATLAFYLGHMLERAETLFGERDKSWAILGVEFAAGGPCLSFSREAQHQIIVQLGPNALRDSLLAVFQLVQEVVHLLSPVHHDKVTLLEEGLATWFAVTYMRDVLKTDCWSSLKGKYPRALSLVEPRVATDTAWVSAMRGQAGISTITEKQLASLPGMSQAHASELAQLAGPMR